MPGPSRSLDVNKYVKNLKTAQRVGTKVGKYLKNLKKSDLFGKKKKQKTGHSVLPKKSGYKASCPGKNVKLGGKQKPLPKVSKHFKARVASALKPKQIISTYNASWHGVLYGPPTGASQMNFQQCSEDATDGAGTALVNGTGAPLFQLFHPLRVLDQASILFNAKTLSTTQDWVSDAGGENFATKGLRVTVLSQSFRVTCHNNTSQSKELLWYQCTPKENTDTTAKACFDACLAEDVADGNLITGGSITSNMYGMTPGAAKNFSSAFSYTVRKMSLAPGQSSKFSVTGPANHTYDWDKYKEMEGTADVTYPKKLGVQLFYIVRNSENLQTVWNNATAYVEDRATGHIADRPTANVLITGITIETRYFAKLVAPEKTPVALAVSKGYFDHHNNWQAANDTTPYAIRIAPEDPRTVVSGVTQPF